jgi:hypothetical protein
MEFAVHLPKRPYAPLDTSMSMGTSRDQTFHGRNFPTAQNTIEIFALQLIPFPKILFLI